MINVMKLKQAHLTELLEGQPILRQYLTPDQMCALENCPHSYSVLDPSGKVIACGGVIEKWEGNAEAWAILDQNSRSHFLEIHNVVKRFLKSCMIRRVTAVVEEKFIAGHRWMQTLGFTLEAAVMTGYGARGENYSLYAKVRLS